MLTSIRASSTSVRALWSAYVVSRLLMVALVLADGLPERWQLGTGISGDVSRVYLPDHLALAHGALPYRNFAYEYPPGSLPFLWVFPGVSSRFGFLALWVAMMLVLDLLIMLALVRLSRATPGADSVWGPWLWVAVGLALGGLGLVRNDLVACAAVAWAIVFLRQQRYRWVGGLLAFGIAAKLWPAVMLAVVLGRRAGRRRVLAGAAAVSLFLTVGLASGGMLLQSLLDVVRYHGGRGVEIEAVPALPVLLAAAIGHHPLSTSNGHGSTNLADSLLLGTWWTLVGEILVVVLAVLALRSRSLRLDALPVVEISAGCLALLMLTDKVFSPQYLLWLTVLSAAALSLGGGRRLAVATAVAATLTGLEYPSLFPYVAQANFPVVLLMLARDIAVAVCGYLALAPYLREPSASRNAAETDRDRRRSLAPHGPQGLEVPGGAPAS